MRIKRSKINILGVSVDDISENQALSQILKLAKDTKKCHIAATVNSEFVMLARKNPAFSKILNNADLAVADGAGVVWAKQTLGGKFQNRITGVDLVEKLCAECAKKAITVGFLGGFANVAEIVANRQKQQNPGLKVVLAEPGEPTISYDSRLKKQFSQIGRIDLLFVAYGMGKQEFWIARNKNNLNVGVFIGVGGAFDYISMVKKRAPRLMQKLALEWLWRLIAEPRRAGRMMVLPLFASLVLWQWFGKKAKFLKN